MSAETSTTQIYMHPREAVRHLVTEGVVHGLDDAKLDELREECWDGSEESLEEAGLLGILTFYYETLDRGARDGFIWHAGEFWNDTDDAVAELAACLHDEKPLFKQVKAKEQEGVLYVALERDDGTRRDVEAHSLADLVAVFNEELEARGQTRRFVELNTGGGTDWEMYVAVEVALALKLLAIGALPVADLDALGD
jgi:hypothetical protein